MGRFCNLVWYWWTHDREPEDVRKFEVQLYRPPVGVVATVGPWTPEAEMAAFQSLKAMLAK